MRLKLLALALALACLLAAPAWGSVWIRSSRDGVCRETWTERDLVRGPTAILNGVLRPLNSFAGGTWFALAECHHSARCFYLGPLWVVGSTVWGLGEGLYWVATGILDTPTLGTLLISPYEATRLQPFPHVPFLESHPPNRDERCP